ncbi:MAG: universal stress protein [Algibacter sp.]|uniref:universal stress protein n=1 Tax=Algibacter sp. TaxID=1872428 RepID=UPI0026063C4A|nr:universal stress protein [Algibacter sp.]MDG1730381.1 universal stress protein [Algibacter sp.]MDG2178859.1 universal stress protein [Algibacter sp.]
MKNILLPTDFSENSWNAIKYAIRFFEKESCNFYLLHIYTLSHVILNDSAQDVLVNVDTQPAKIKLRKVLKRIGKVFTTNKKHRFYTLFDYNFFIESIRKHVEEKKIDCIVMGTKGASGLKKIIVGSNTGDVITKVKCTTLVVPEDAQLVKLKEIAFPTDFALSNNIQILDPLSEILEKNQSALRILHISKKKAELNRDQNKSKELLEDYFSHLYHSFHYLTNKKVEDAVQCFIESRNINMICMVAKNLNYFQQILFHSKVEAISYHTEIPFLVLHEKQ